jgi:hypothetical protein
LIKTLLSRKKPSIKQGLPVEKKPLLTAAFITVLLLSMVAGMRLVKEGNANDNTVIYGNTNAKITIQSPENKTYKENNVTLAFTIESDVPPTEYFNGSVLDLCLRHGVVLDYDTAKLVDILDTSTFPQGGFPDDVPITLSAIGNRYVGNATLTGLSHGSHNITVWIRAEQYMISYSGLVWAVFSTVSFSISPQITILSPETKAYNISDVPLDFMVDGTFSEIEYSLDGQSNMTINGNTTLTGLPNGDHNVTVYATDQFGNTGASETIYFSVEVPEPFPTTIVAASIASVVIIGAGLVLYFTKIKKTSGKIK